MHIHIVGAGVAGLVTAATCLDRGHTVELFERHSETGKDACSWWAGGMLAPWCEVESAEQAVLDLGAPAIDWWEEHVSSVERKGTLVVAPSRDVGELDRFSRRTSDFETLDAEAIALLEPDLAGRFRRGLYFKQEAHLSPRLALADLAHSIQTKGGVIHYRADDRTSAQAPADRVIDARGFAARKDLPDMRGVKGEMLILKTRDVSLSRPVRLLHPRIPLYIVPRGDGLYMVGATMIESEDRERITARSMVELLNSAYTLHPAFGEAEIVEIGVDVRPAFPDNLPRVQEIDNTVYINGFYRHGFLLTPAYSGKAVDLIEEKAS
jgi:glycine oxidase